MDWIRPIIRQGGEVSRMKTEAKLLELLILSSRHPLFLFRHRPKIEKKIKEKIELNPTGRLESEEVFLLGKELCPLRDRISD